MKLIYSIFLFVLVLFSCNNEKPKEEMIVVPSAQETADMNKDFVLEEQELISQFVARRNWEMTQTESGLWYLVYKKGDGKQAEPGMRAMVSYTISGLDGSEYYSTKDSGPVPFRIEQDNVEPGLHEGITYLKEGDHAKMIIPYYLGHGLLGDADKIPPLASLVFDIKLLGVSN